MVSKIDTNNQRQIKLVKSHLLEKYEALFREMYNTYKIHTSKNGFLSKSYINSIDLSRKFDSMLKQNNNSKALNLWNEIYLNFNSQSEFIIYRNQLTHSYRDSDNKLYYSDKEKKHEPTLLDISLPKLIEFNGKIDKYSYTIKQITKILK